MLVIKQLSYVMFFPYYGSQWLPLTVWLPTFFKISMEVNVNPVCQLNITMRKVQYNRYCHLSTAAVTTAKWQANLNRLDQGSSNLSLEVQSAAEFSSNPDQTYLPVIF